MNEGTNRYRFAVEDDGSIYRARLINADHPDAWQFYWDVDGVVAFYDEHSRGVRPMDAADPEETERAITAYRYSQTDGLSRLASRITGEDASEFIVVHLDRDTDLWVLSWDGDPKGEWRDEIEAVYHGEIYRVEVEKFTPGVGWPVSGEPSDWTHDDLMEEWYGESVAEREFSAAYPLTEFPAERIVLAGD